MATIRRRLLQAAGIFALLVAVTPLAGCVAYPGGVVYYDPPPVVVVPPPIVVAPPRRFHQPHWGWCRDPWSGRFYRCVR